jgi:hypothetical protein
MSTDHAVTESLSLFGDWFLPTSPERRLAGDIENIGVDDLLAGEQAGRQRQEQ